jgi:hypothetical protein
MKKKMERRMEMESTHETVQFLISSPLRDLRVLRGAFESYLENSIQE